METNNTDVVIRAVNTNILVGIVRNNSSKNATATKAGIPISTFSRKLNGHGDFSIRELGMIADALNLKFEDLLPTELLMKQVG
ncbi:helix-turn-helix domain-containing protein [Streptomyces diacarni]|uniref:helix-turn-helix domain-containing protein n=1 Tax=Streptomyces diacarni TaxID=2800381 RepID=UPI0033C4FB0C